MCVVKKLRAIHSKSEMHSKMRTSIFSVLIWSKLHTNSIEEKKKKRNMLAQTRAGREIQFHKFLSALDRKALETGGLGDLFDHSIVLQKSKS